MEACSSHAFAGESELRALRTDLLSWYDENRRDLPWRRKVAIESDPNVRGYVVWVSEVMLQQTQVATVVEYYQKWMEKWPTVEKLATASLEEVKEAWSGLGYYSRAQRLWEAAKKVVMEMDGQIPRTASDLSVKLPGVGRYTAAAIASIAYGEGCGVVDGNVMRVWSRVKMIGANTNTQTATEHFWKLSTEAVDRDRPGDFNQALMELGATVCTPRSPTCSSCPLSKHCGAAHRVQDERRRTSLHGYTSDVSASLSPVAASSTSSPSPSPSSCPLCLPHNQPWDPSVGVMNYPRKAKKKPVKEEHFAVGVVEVGGERKPSEVLIQKRPDSGLLAGLWEFPCIPVRPDCPVEQTWQHLCGHLVIPADNSHSFVGTVSHQFSHTLHHYHVWHIPQDHPPPLPPSPPHKWVTYKQLLESAISTAVRKIHKLVTGTTSKPTSRGRQSNDSSCSEKPRKRQKTVDEFFH